jgi:UDP-N-acetylglucosamine 2-epimerase
VKVVCAVGARPNFVKIAPILRAFTHAARDRPDLSVRLIHTGQHYDVALSESIFSDLEIPPPHINLGVSSGTHAEQTARVLTGFEEVLLGERPDLMIVVGDVNSTLACALAAAKVLVPVAHVEAGLRSGDRTMPRHPLGDRRNSARGCQSLPDGSCRGRVDRFGGRPGGNDGASGSLPDASHEHGAGITVEEGTNRLVGLDRLAIEAAVEEILAGKWPVGQVPPLWDGRAAERVADIVLGPWAARRGLGP